MEDRSSFDAFIASVREIIRIPTARIEAINVTQYNVTAKGVLKSHFYLQLNKFSTLDIPESNISSALQPDRGILIEYFIYCYTTDVRRNATVEFAYDTVVNRLNSSIPIGVFTSTLQNTAKQLKATSLTNAVATFANIVFDPVIFSTFYRSPVPSNLPTSQPSSTPSLSPTSTPTNAPTYTYETQWRVRLNRELVGRFGNKNRENYNYYLDMVVQENTWYGGVLAWQTFVQHLMKQSLESKALKAISIVNIDEVIAPARVQTCNDSSTANLIWEASSKMKNISLQCNEHNWLVSTCHDEKFPYLCIDCLDPCVTVPTVPSSVFSLNRKHQRDMLGGYLHILFVDVEEIELSWSVLQLVYGSVILSTLTILWFTTFYKHSLAKKLDIKSRKVISLDSVKKHVFTKEIMEFVDQQLLAYEFVSMHWYSRLISSLATSHNTLFLCCTDYDGFFWYALYFVTLFLTYSSSMLAINDFFYPMDDGKCSAMTTEEDCLSIVTEMYDIPYILGQRSICNWVVSNVENGDEVWIGPEGFQSKCFWKKEEIFCKEGLLLVALCAIILYPLRNILFCWMERCVRSTKDPLEQKSHLIKKVSPTTEALIATKKHSLFSKWNHESKQTKMRKVVPMRLSQPKDIESVSTRNEWDHQSRGSDSQTQELAPPDDVASRIAELSSPLVAEHQTGKWNTNRLTIPQNNLAHSIVPLKDESLESSTSFSQQYLLPVLQDSRRCLTQFSTELKFFDEQWGLHDHAFHQDVFTKSNASCGHTYQNPKDYFDLYIAAVHQRVCQVLKSRTNGAILAREKVRRELIAYFVLDLLGFKSTEATIYEQRWGKWLNINRTFPFGRNLRIISASLVLLLDLGMLYYIFLMNTIDVAAVTTWWKLIVMMFFLDFLCLETGWTLWRDFIVPAWCGARMKQIRQELHQILQSASDTEDIVSLDIMKHLFVSKQLAQVYPSLLEGKLIQGYRPMLPKSVLLHPWKDYEDCSWSATLRNWNPIVSMWKILITMPLFVGRMMSGLLTLMCLATLWYFVGYLITWFVMGVICSVWIVLLVISINATNHIRSTLTTYDPTAVVAEVVAEDNASEEVSIEEKVGKLIQSAALLEVHYDEETSENDSNTRLETRVHGTIMVQRAQGDLVVNDLFRYDADAAAALRNELEEFKKYLDENGFQSDSDFNSFSSSSSGTGEESEEGPGDESDEDSFDDSSSNSSSSITARSSSESSTSMFNSDISTNSFHTITTSFRSKSHASLVSTTSRSEEQPTTTPYCSANEEEVKNEMVVDRLLDQMESQRDLSQPKPSKSLLAQVNSARNNRSMRKSSDATASEQPVEKETIRSMFPSLKPRVLSMSQKKHSEEIGDLLSHIKSIKKRPPRKITSRKSQDSAGSADADQTMPGIETIPSQDSMMSMVSFKSLNISKSGLLSRSVSQRLSQKFMKHIDVEASSSASSSSLSVDTSASSTHSSSSESKALKPDSSSSSSSSSSSASNASFASFHTSRWMSRDEMDRQSSKRRSRKL